ncbi:MAG: hypothetical protein JO247_10515 [Chloroflexi bacterium]|nr:hypothetical protein [Chloroflexota bacterium]
MPSTNDRPLADIVGEVDGLSQNVIRLVLAFVNGRGVGKRDIEDAVLRGLIESAEAAEQLNRRLESVRAGRQEVDGVVEALEVVEQKVAFFQGCTMRRSAAFGSPDQDAEAHARDAERISAEARASGSLERLVETYKSLERLEGQIIRLRGDPKASPTPEPRVLDLERARVLVARRLVGAAVVALDEDGDEEP